MYRENQDLYNIKIAIQKLENKQIKYMKGLLNKITFNKYMKRTIGAHCKQPMRDSVKIYE